MDKVTIEDQGRVNNAIAIIKERITYCMENIVEYKERIDEMNEIVREINNRIYIAENAFAHLENLDAFLDMRENIFLLRMLSVEAPTKENKDALAAFIVNENIRLREEEKRLDNEAERLEEEKERLDRMDDALVHLVSGVSGKTWRRKTNDPFFSQVGSAKEENNILMFPARIPLTKQDKLYIRSAYRVIYDAAVTRADATKRKYALVTGTPGNGKSAFLYYAFWRMVKAKQRVFFVEPMIYFDGESMRTLSAMPSLKDFQFWKPDLWCLIDSADPTNAGLCFHYCSILLVATPCQDRTSRFRKLVPSPPVFYMPLWSHEELQAIADWYPCRDWESRYIVLGGIPRYVLQDLSEPPESLLMSACHNCELKDVVRLISVDSHEPDIVQRLIHLHSEEPFTDAEVRYASPTAIRMIVRTNWYSCIREVVNLLDTLEWNPLAAALCAHIFESHAKKLLQKGGTFQCRELVVGHAQKKPKCEITIPKSPKPAIVAGTVAPDQEKNQLYFSKTSSVASIDAWMPEFGAFQMMVGKSHEIKDGAADDVNVLGDNGRRLFWLLPPLYFNSFRKKEAANFQFKQYAILMPCPDVDDRSSIEDADTENEDDMEDEQVDLPGISTDVYTKVDCRRESFGMCSLS